MQKLGNQTGDDRLCEGVAADRGHGLSKSFQTSADPLETSVRKPWPLSHQRRHENLCSVCTPILTDQHDEVVDQSELYLRVGGRLPLGAGSLQKSFDEIIVGGPCTGAYRDQLAEREVCAAA